MEAEVVTPTRVSEAPEREVCKFYRQGTCRYGSMCRNAHVGTVEPLPYVVVGHSAPSSSANSYHRGHQTASSKGAKSKFDPSTWIQAPEFIPKTKEAEAQPPSYAQIVTMNNNHTSLGIEEPPMSAEDVVLCPYMENSGLCPVENCEYEHGDLCELCGKYCLSPSNTEQRRLHNIECIKQHEADMEHSFAVQRSKDKVCGICLEVILEKPGREQRFGILPNCNHIFCLDCIRTWRKAKNFENKIKRGCPTCRISSDFVCPSMIWVEAGEEKDKLLNDYRTACNTTHCKHFKQGSGKCPFGNKCFYKHALPCGQLVDVGGPSRQVESRRRIHSEFTHLQDFFRQVISQRDRLLDDFVASFFSDSEDSDISELYDYYSDI